MSQPGTVTFAGIKHGYGNLVIVDHGQGISTYYAHLSSIYVGVGQQVALHQVLGAVGSTGRSTGPHLHYEVRLNGHPINPTSTISIVNGSFLVNGQPFVDGGEETGVSVGEPSSRLEDDPIENESRPRRVGVVGTSVGGVEKRVLTYAKNSLGPN